MARAPAVRVSAARDMLDFVERFEPGARARVLATFPADTLEIFETSARSSWFPIEHDHWVVDGIVRVFGTTRAVQCWRDSIPDLVDKPLLRSFVSGMARMFGGDPSRFLTVVPKGWGLVFNDFCDMKVGDNAPGRVSLVLDDVAESVRRYPNYFHAWNGILQGVAKVGRVRGVMEFVVAKDFRRAEAIFTW